MKRAIAALAIMLLASSLAHALPPNVLVACAQRSATPYPQGPDVLDDPTGDPLHRYPDFLAYLAGGGSPIPQDSWAHPVCISTLSPTQDWTFSSTDHPSVTITIETGEYAGRPYTGKITATLLKVQSPLCAQPAFTTMFILGDAFPSGTSNPISLAPGCTYKLRVQVEGIIGPVGYGVVFDGYVLDAA